MDLMQNCGILDFCANLLQTIHNPKQFLRFPELRWVTCTANQSKIVIEGSARLHKPLELLGIMQGSGQVGVGLLEPDFHKMCAALSGPQDKREKEEWREGPSGSGGGGARGTGREAAGGRD